MTSKAMHPALYRVYQFFVALKAYLPIWAGGIAEQGTVEDEAWLRAVLPTQAQQQLFARMSPNDQRHGLAVARTLQQAGHSQPALLQAALLHDVAKSLSQPILHRVLIVLLEAFWPAALSRLAGQIEGQVMQAGQVEARLRGPGWRRPFIVHAYHPLIGAAWAEAAGCEAGAVTLIRKHQEKLAPAPDQDLLALLQWADSLN
jgi:hypothetical protein